MKNKNKLTNIKKETSTEDIENEVIISSHTKVSNDVKKKKVKKERTNILFLILGIILILVSLYNLYFNIINKQDVINRSYIIINSSVLFLISVIITITLISKNITKKIFNYLLVISMFSYLSFNILIDNNIIKLETQKLVPNLIGMTYQEADIWAKENNITLNTIYEYSDIYDEYQIINQDITVDQLLKNTEKINLIISNGPNYDKTIILNNMVGWNIDDAIKESKANFLNNITIKYTKDNNTEKDIIIAQNIKGQIRRNDELIFTVSLGETEFKEITMINLNNKTLFDAKLWLDRNNIKYKISYDFDENIKRNYVISTSITEGNNINSSDVINLIVSKGKSITVPNIITMTIDEVTNWIINNNLKISYDDKYDDNIPLGGIISTNYNEGDIIEEETIIKLVTSKGPLKMEKFSSLNEFRTWANNYNINYDEEYKYNDNVAKGKIIKFSINEGDIIKNDETIIVYISNGKAITIPNFVNKTKDEAKKLCNSLGLNCSFKYGSYGSTSKDKVTDQNKKVGVTVISGTYVTLTLSKGPAESCKIYIQPTWFGSTADATISTLKTKLADELSKKGCSDITFKYVKKASNEGNSGMIHPDSKVSGGNNTFTEGNTYTITIISN